MTNGLRRRSASFLITALALLLAPAAGADVVTTASLRIQGAGFQVLTTTATVQLGSPALIQTSFGGLQNDAAPVIDGVVAVGELVGPGITTPVEVTTAPGHAFQVAGLSQEGVYYLQNIRLTSNGQLLQMAVPSLAIINVTNALNATVTVRQLTADELRARGISVDPSNYDVFGRLRLHLTKDAAVESMTFDEAGHPLTTRQKRYKDSSGFGDKTVLDQFEETHTWNAFGERTSWTMPRPSSLTASGWTDKVSQAYDGAGNLTLIARTQTGGGTVATLMSATFRNAGRPTTRSLTTSCTGLAQPCTSGAIVRNYGYDAATGQLNEMQVVANGTTVAGTHVNYQSTLQAHDLQLLGISSGTRFTHLGYDDRGRLTSSIFGTNEPPAPAGGTAIGLTPADFLTAKSRTPLIDNPTRTLLTSRGVTTAAIDAIDPPTTTFAEKPAAHKTDSVTRAGVTRSVLYDQNGHDGGQVSDDGRLIYAWDPRGLLLSATQKPAADGAIIRRMLYYYDGNHRLVGRRAEVAVASPVTTPLSDLNWQLETRVDVLAADGFPPEVTFVWDPVSDNLVTVVQVGAPPSDPNGGVLRQIIHGGLGYDDPLEVTAVGSAGTLTRLYPTYDESGTGSLQTVLDASSQLVARNVPTDAYGDDHLEIDGPAVDSVSLDATRDSQGLVTVEVTIRSTEAIVASSLATGIRLATVDSNGAVVRTAPGPATLVANDPYAVHLSVTPDDWTALTDPSATSSGGLTAAALSIAATSTLRANGWSPDLPFLPAPDWARASQPIFASAALPLEVRESLASLSAALAATPAGQSTTLTLYKVDNLALLARPSTVGDTPITTLLAARFQAQPFADPFTGMNYVRERWYDPEHGSWLSPDPIGNGDSANLYAFCAGDPVNCSDPTGEITIIVHGTLAGNDKKKPKSDLWWRNGGGFAANVDIGAGDVWKIATAGGKPVSEIPELADFGPGGMFKWGFFNDNRHDRREAARRLAEYINTIRRLYPTEPIRVVTHSHGGNVATAATNGGFGFTPAKIDTLIVLGKPYLTWTDDLGGLAEDPYEVDPQNVRDPVLNIFSNEDRVQVTIASAFAGEPDVKRFGPLQNIPMETRIARTATNEDLAWKFINAEVKTDVGGLAAHGVLHGRRMGRAIGSYLSQPGRTAADWQRAMRRGGVPRPIVDPDAGD